MSDYKKQYEELIDALCSKSWWGRNRHHSVLALAKRLRESQSLIRALEGRPLPQRCMRDDGHEGPCNGFPRPVCERHAFAQLAEIEDAANRSNAEALAALRSHKWVGQQQGGNPADAASYEWVRYCEVCGAEDTCEDPLDPCLGAKLDE